jgi:septum formation protein
LPSPPLILVSASPRRRDLLSRLTKDFQVGHSTVEERDESGLDTLPLYPIALPSPFEIGPEADPRLWSWRKVIDYVNMEAAHLQDAFLLGADTVVVARTELLGKPRNSEDALRMLRLLSDDSHFVTTGYCLLTLRAGKIREPRLGTVSAEVVMKKSTPEQLAAYIRTGEPYDKAGAYALQGLGGELVREVRGCRTTVIGLPICVVRAELETLGLNLEPTPFGGYCEACAYTRNAPNTSLPTKRP